MSVFRATWRDLKIHTAAIGHFVGFVFGLCGLYLPGVELHFGGRISNRCEMPSITLLKEVIAIVMNSARNNQKLHDC